MADSLVSRFGCYTIIWDTTASVYRAVERAAQWYATRYRLAEGVTHRITVKVAGWNVRVNGRVVNGEFRIGTFRMAGY